MKQFDIEAYLAGNLSGQALQQFKKELKNNPAFAREVAVMRQLAEDMETIALRQEVREALSESSSTPSRRMDYKWWGFLFILVLLVLYVVLFYH